MLVRFRWSLPTFVFLWTIPMGCRDSAQFDQEEAYDVVRSVENPAFKVPGLANPSACREPTDPLAPMSAGAGRYCRQMKQVQAWLNLLLDSRTLYADLGISDSDRQEAFFGPDPSAEDVGAQLTRVAAVLLASDCPIDRRDYEVGTPFIHDDITLPSVCGIAVGTAIPVTEWLWELPHVYADEPDIQERARMMRKDAAEWLLNVGIPEFDTSPGSIGDYDGKMIKILKMTYMIASAPGRFDGLPAGTVANLLDRLVRQGFNRTTYDPPQAHIDDDWSLTEVPMSGQDFDEYMEEENMIPGPGGDPWLTPETENHVLNALTYHYLTNQLIAVLSDTYLDPDQYMGDLNWGSDPLEWFEYANTDLEDLLVEVVSRVNYNGMFETDAKPYQRISIEALLLLSNYALEDRVRNAATNALHYLAAKNAFQSLDGRSYAPRRRSCDQAWQQTLVTGVDRIFAILSGHFKWNDSPYGFRDVADELAPDIDDCIMDPAPLACFSNMSWPTTDCESNPECHWYWYTWKRSQLLTPNQFKYSDEDAGIPQGQGSSGLGPHVPAFARVQSVTSVSFSSQDAEAEFWAAFSNYKTPEAVQSFSQDKRYGYWARAMSRYHLGHYWPKGEHFVTIANAQAAHLPAQYFDSIGEPYSPSTRVQRFPELWFAGRGFMNVSGGMYNSYYGENEEYRYYQPVYEISQLVTCSKEGQWRNYVEDYNKNDEFNWLLSGGDWHPDMSMQDYDAFARPTALLFGVPSTPIDQNNVAYTPYGLRSFPYEMALGYMPMMVGNERAPWRSVNVGTYKNFSYGYLQHCNPTDSSGCDENYGDWAVNLPNYGAAPYEFALDGDTDIPVRFRVYDLRQVMENDGLEPIWLVTGKVWKKRPSQHSMKHFARSFWEVLPGEWYDDAEEIEDDINANHSSANFPASATIFQDIDEPFRYRLLSTGETVDLTPRFGAVVPALWYKFWKYVQGIPRIEEAGGGYLDRATYYINLCGLQDFVWAAFMG